jgi:glycosyltransferase involved in cell wall biosynthesis
MTTSTITRTEKQYNFLCLYSRLPGYFYRCLEELVATTDHIHVHCIAYRPASEAPYELAAGNRITLQYKEDLSKEAIMSTVDELQPDLVYVAGWADSTYKAIAKKYRNKIPVIVGMDNPWTGSLKQRVATLIAPFFLKPFFSKIWVPGNKQYEFARRLGFRHQDIMQGLYCADHTLYVAPTTKDFTTKKILYVGRFVEYKRPTWLAEAFKAIVSNGQFKNWELIMIGNGPLKESLQSAAHGFNIRIIDFRQPAEILAFFQEATVFCLPSHHEHWGVVVHEAAFAGLPMILSDTCGATETFLIEGYNGYMFDSGSPASLKNCLQKIMNAEDERLSEMGRASTALAGRVTHETWVATLLSTLENN